MAGGALGVLQACRVFGTSSGGYTKRGWPAAVGVAHPDAPGSPTGRVPWGLASV